MRQENSPAAEGTVDPRTELCDWMHAVVTECQRVINQMHTVRAGKLDFSQLRSLPEPSSRIEELLLHGLLLEVCAKAGGRQDVGIAEYAIRVIEERTSRRRRYGVQDAVKRAARMIEARYAEPLDVPRLACELNCREATLRAQFARTFGMSPRVYHRAARVRAASALFASGTNDVLSVARMVGYRSEKNFYAAVRQVTGGTPAELRSAANCVS